MGWCSAIPFDLGVNNGQGTTTPHTIVAALFSPNTNGTFATAGNRFAYDQSTGNLYYDVGGSAMPASSVRIADLTNKPHLAAANLFFTS
jgi:Ca2+-binding RTX toxin-like protein